jgi:prepilin-type N-terminal cleavage/methylation domain-containing protein/prepilin-type processing-associated H-X9-DG protein
MNRSYLGKIGFTLIELLVVIAIIAILASILFPVLISAKRSAYQSTCASNLKQFSTAFSLYADDWSGRYPLPGGTLTPTTVWLHDAGNGQQIGALWKYLRTKLSSGAKNNLWSCPLAIAVADKSAGFSPGQNYIMNDYVRAGHSGELNGYNPNVLGYGAGIIPSACPHPSKIILLYEGVQDVDGFCARLGSPFYIADANPLRPSANHAFVEMKYANLPQNYHNGKSNFLLLDGHVKLLSPAETLDQNSYKYSCGSIKYWKQIYKTCGDYDYWNPQVAGVNYP